MRLLLLLILLGGLLAGEYPVPACLRVRHPFLPAVHLLSNMWTLHDWHLPADPSLLFDLPPALPQLRVGHRVLDLPARLLRNQQHLLGVLVTLLDVRISIGVPVLPALALTHRQLHLLMGFSLSAGSLYARRCLPALPLQLCLLQLIYRVPQLPHWLLPRQLCLLAMLSSMPRLHN